MFASHCNTLYVDVKSQRLKLRLLCLFQVKELREQLHKRRMKTSQASERYVTNFYQ